MYLEEVRKNKIDPAKEYLIEIKKEQAYSSHYKLASGFDLIIYLKTLKQCELDFKAYILP